MAYDFKTRMYTLGKRNFIRQTTAIKRDVAESTHFYRQNIKDNLRKADYISRVRSYGSSKKLATKVAISVTNFKVRRKDIFPALFSAIGFAVPFPGMGLLGFGIGKGVNKLIKTFLFKKF